MYIYYFYLFFLSKSHTLSLTFSQNFGSPLDFHQFVKKVGTKKKDLNEFGIQPTNQYLLNTGHKHFLGLIIYQIKGYYITFFINFKGKCSFSKNFNKMMLHIL